MKSLLCFGLLVTGCGLDPVSSGKGDFVKESIQKELSFDSPVAVEVFVATRAVDYAAGMIEYEIAIAERPITITYWLAAGDERPLHTMIYDAGTRWFLNANDRVLDVYRDDALAFRVDNYLTASATVTDLALPAAFDTAIANAAAATLVIRSELGVVPDGFFNRRPRQSDDTGVTMGGGFEPLIESWQAPVSLLGAYVVQGACLGQFASAAPCCISFDSPETGVVGGSCQ